MSAGIAAAGCVRGPEPLSPAALPPLSGRVVAGWIRDLTPDGPIRYDLQWTYQTQRGRARGRAAVRFAPPDSLRFDYRGPFGRSGAAVIVGDSVLWAEPADEVESFIPVAALFWTAIGLPRTPPAGAAVYGTEQGTPRVWRFRHGAREETYVETQGEDHRLRMELRRLDDLVGTAQVSFDAAGVPANGIVTFAAAATLFTITVRDVEKLAQIDPAIWREP